MEILFLLVGLVFFAFGVAIVLFEARSRRGAWAVPAEVIGFSTGKGVGSGAPSYHPVAEYAGMDGCKRYLEGSVGSSSPLGAVGDAVTVLVQPDDPEKAVLKSSLTYVIGAALALMGLASCIVFFAVFRATTFSIVGAVGVVTWTAYKFRGSIRERPMSLQAWRKYKDAALRPRVFTDASKAEIPWADPEALRTAIDSISSNPPSYRTGDAVGVLYDPDHPRDARIDRGRWNKAVPILIGGSGVFLCLLGLWILKRRPPATSRTPS